MARQSPQVKKDALLGELATVRQKIFERSRQIDPTQVNEAFVGHWSIMELLAHLEGWDHANQEAAEAIMAGRLPAFYDHAGQDWSEFNRRLVRRHRRPDLQRMLAAVMESHKEFLAYMETIPAAEFFEDRGLRYKGYKVIISRLLKSEAEDEAVHLRQIETFLSKDRPA